jgi:PAS domain-containing protein
VDNNGDREVSHRYSEEYLGFWLLNAQNCICYISSTISDLLGYTSQDLVDGCLSKIVDQSTFQFLQNRLLQESTLLQSCDCQLRHKNGHELDLSRGRFSKHIYFFD